MIFVAFEVLMTFFLIKFQLLDARIELLLSTFTDRDWHNWLNYVCSSTKYASVIARIHTKPQNQTIRVLHGGGRSAASAIRHTRATSALLHLRV